MRRVSPLRLAALLVVVLAGAAPPVAAAPVGFSTAAERPLAAGLDHSRLIQADPETVANVARIGPGAPVELRAVSSDNRITHHGETLEMPSSMCRRLHCIVAVNADYHSWSHEPLGGVVTGGRMIRSPVGGRPQLSVTTSGQLIAGPLDGWRAVLRTSDGRSLDLGGINTTSAGTGRITLYTPDWGTSTETSGATELVVRAAEPLGRLGRPVAVELVDLDSGPSPIPADGAVLSATGEAASVLEELWRRHDFGVVSAQAEILVNTPTPVVESIGGFPTLLRGGQVAHPGADDGFTRSRHPRTAVGWNAAGEIFIVAVDGRQGDSKGMTLDELAHFMQGMGATEALNLDGGGSTTFVVDGVVSNQPVDGNLVGAERGAANALVVVPAGTPPTPGPPPGGGPAPGSSTGLGLGQLTSASSRAGYWMVSENGAVHTFGDARPWGDAVPHLGPNRAVDLEPTPSSQGYWIVDSAGRVFAFGDARYLGNVDSGILAPGETVTSLSATPSGYGYWIFTSRGRVVRFGDAPFAGDMSKTALNGPVLDSIPTPSGRGYYMVAADGGIFAFGDARFHGSMGDQRLNAPVQSLVPDPDGTGYWLVASDGGVFSFDAHFRGSMGDRILSRPVSGMVAFGDGYLMVGEDGGIFNFSDKAFLGSLGDRPPASPVVSVAAFAR